MIKKWTKSVPRAFPFTFSIFPLDWSVLQHILPFLLLSSTFHHLTSRQRLIISNLRKSSTHKKKLKKSKYPNVQIFRFSTSPTTVPPSSFITTISPTHGFSRFELQKKMGSTLGRLRHSALVLNGEVVTRPLPCGHSSFYCVLLAFFAS